MIQIAYDDISVHPHTYWHHERLQTGEYLGETEYSGCIKSDKGEKRPLKHSAQLNPLNW